MEKSTKIATGAGTAAGAGAGGTLVAITSGLAGPAANLGGYATAQIVGSTVGVTGPALASGIAAIGGPITAGVLLTAAVGTGVFLGVKGICSLFD